MGLIKKHYQKIISYGLIALGALLIIFTLIRQPQKMSIQEIYDHNNEPTLSKISFPYSIEISTTTDKISYIELYFGDDSINQHKYTVSVLKDSKSLFEHTYINEESNIVQLPLVESDVKPNDNIVINISCKDSCENVKFELYDTPKGQLPKIGIASTSTDYRYLWLGSFLLAVGLTLYPLTKRTRK